MTSFEDFQAQYEEELLPDLLELKKEISWRNTLQLGLLALVFIAAIILFVLVAMNLLVFWVATILLLLVAALAIWQVYQLSDRRDIQANYKRVVMSKIIQMAAPRGEYYPEDHIPYKNFHESGLFTQTPDYFGGDDLVLTMQKGTPVKFSEVKAAWHEEGYDDKGKDMSRWHTIFDGVFMVAYLKAKFPDTVVVPDVSRGSFGKLGQDTHRANKEFGDYVSLEHPEFSRYFTVYATDAKKARTLISHEFMDRAVSIAKQTDLPIFISFKGKKMFLAIHFSRALFEINPYSTKIIRPEKPYSFFKEMEFIANIAPTLKSNREPAPKEAAMPTLSEMFDMMEDGGGMDFGGMFG